MVWPYTHIYTLNSIQPIPLPTNDVEAVFGFVLNPQAATRARQCCHTIESHQRSTAIDYEETLETLTDERRRYTIEFLADQPPRTCSGI